MEEMLVFGEENPLIGEIIGEDGHPRAFGHNSSLAHADLHIGDPRYSRTHFSGSHFSDGKRLEYGEDGSSYAVDSDAHYFSSFDSAPSSVARCDATAFELPLRYAELRPSASMHHLDTAIPQSEDAPQLSYEGVAEASDAQYEAHISSSPSPSGDHLDVSCPILVSERPQSPQHLEEGEGALGDGTVPCSSHGASEEGDGRWTGANPLRRFSVLVGHKKLTFKVVDAPGRHSFSRDGGVGIEELEMGVERHGDVRFKCFVCGRMFASRSALKEHQASHTGAKPQVCSFCGRTFFHKQSLVMHERMHTGEKPFQCPICTKCFARQTNYNIHMKLHASGRRYFCSFCGKWFRSEPEMLDHQQQCIAQMHGVAVQTDRPLRYQCTYCEKMFHHRRDKNIHERTHTGERPYSCGYCGKGFTQSQALTIHIRTHTGERPYTCGICAKDFRDSSALRKHEFIKHTNMRGTPTYTTGIEDVVVMSLPPLLTPEQQFQPVTASFQ